MRTAVTDGEICTTCDTTLHLEALKGVTALIAYLGKWADFEREYGPNDGKERSRPPR